MEDNGYETARLKGVDVLGNVCIMLRQRGLKIVSVMGTPPSSSSTPLTGIPSAQDHSESEAMVVRCSTRTVGAPAGAGPLPGSMPIIRAEVVADAPPGTSAALHLERGVRSVGDQVWVYMLTSGKVGIKQVRALRDSWQQEPMPKIVVILSREKMSSQAADFVNKDGVALEKFLFSEISYNITRHFLVPKHWLLSVQETADLKKKYQKLALQARDDVISRYHGLCSGDVVAYHRVRLGSLGGIYYREVI
jgi:DNA-directed RNA polymerase subunit H (RpoH/RPB5)